MIKLAYENNNSYIYLYDNTPHTIFNIINLNIFFKY